MLNLSQPSFCPSPLLVALRAIAGAARFGFAPCWLLAACLGAQTGPLSIIAGKIDFSGAAHTLPTIVVATVGALPSSGCKGGELAIVTAATLGQQLYENSGTGTCTWTQQTGGGGGTGGGITVYSAASLSLTGTQYIPIGGGGLPSGTETSVDTASPSTATVTNFDVQLSSAPGTGNSIAFTWRKNASSQSLTCTVSNSSTGCSDNTHSFNVSQGDLLTIQLVTSGVIAGTPNLVISAQFGTTGSNGTVNTGTINQTAYYAAAGTAVSGIGPGSSGQVYTSQGSGSAPTFTTVPTTNQNIRTIGASFGSFQSGASALSGSQTACVPTYLSGTIQSVEIVGNVSGSATIDVQTVAHSSWTGTASVSSITAADIPALSSASKYTDTTLTGWTTTVTAGTDFCFVMTSPTTVAGLSITLKVAAN